MKKLKRLATLCIALTMCVVVAAGLASCGRNSEASESEKPHNFLQTVIEPTCTKDGYTLSKCKDCGYEKKSNIVAALGHDIQEIPVVEPDSNWCEDGGFVTEICSRCNETIGSHAVEPQGHSVGKWKIFKTPSYYEGGSVYGRCAVCDGNIVKDIPACSDSAYTVSDITPTNASCMDDKKGDLTIAIDGQKIVVKDVVIPGTNHKLEGMEVFSDITFDAATPGLRLLDGQPAVCGNNTEPAKAYFTCDVCRQNVLVNVKAAHTKPTNIPDDEDHRKAATCVKDGWIKYNCAMCDEELIESIPAFGHDYIYTVTKEGDNYTLVCECQREGCTGERHTVTYTEFESVKETRTEADGCIYGNIHYDFVTASGESISIDIGIPGSAHSVRLNDGTIIEMPENIVYNYDDVKDYVNLFGNVDLTCSGGYGCFTCSYCKEAVIVSVRGNYHAFRECIEIKEPTCETDGKIIYNCLGCGKKNIEEIRPALGHDYIYTVTKDGDNYTIVGECHRNSCSGEGHTVTYTEFESVKETRTEAYGCIFGNIHYDFVTASGESISIDIKIPGSEHSLILNDGTILEMPENIVYNYDDVKDYVIVLDGIYPTCGGKYPCVFSCVFCKKFVAVYVRGSHSPKDIMRTEPTCETDGKMIYNCSECGEKNIEEVLPALGHDIVYIEPVENDDGKYAITAKCSRVYNEIECGYENTIIFDEAPERKVIKDATCCDSGLMIYIVKVDGGTVLITTEIPKTPHMLNGMYFNPDGILWVSDMAELERNHIVLFADEVLSSDKPANALFICDVCAKRFTIKVQLKQNLS